VEVIGMTGMVEADAHGNPVAVLHGVLAEPNGTISGGRFLPGQNPVCVTFEIVLEEWLPDAVPAGTIAGAHSAPVSDAMGSARA
jgi:predicted DNA-binding protein with PD1-like motif